MSEEIKKLRYEISETLLKIRNGERYANAQIPKFYSPSFTLERGVGWDCGGIGIAGYLTPIRGKPHNASEYPPKHPHIWN